MEYKDTIENA